jgi:hypothetical protein
MLVPTSQELERRLKGLLDGVAPDERQEWVDHPCTQALASLFEVVRLQCFEEFEGGVSPEMGYKLAGQASLMSDLSDFLRNDVLYKEGDDDDSD